MDVLKNIKLIERMEIIVEQQSQILKDIKEEYKREQSENVGGEDLSMSDNDQEDPPAENGQILERANNIRTLHENLEIPKEWVQPWHQISKTRELGSHECSSDVLGSNVGEI